MFENLKYNIKLFIATVLMTFIVLLSWNNFYNLGCLSILFPFIVLVIISYSFIDIKTNERICFRNCYFRKESIFSKILTSRVSITIFYLIVSMLLTFSIMSGIISYPNIMWFYLLVHVIIVMIIYKQIIKLLKNTIQDRYLYIFAREWTINLSSLLLLFVYIYAFMDGYVPEYLSSGFIETIENASGSISSGCVFIDYVLRLHIEFDGASWWFITNSAESMKDETVKSVIWISFILVNSLVVLGINRFIVQIVYMLNHIFKRENSEK